jgi:peroxiredoxin/YHS domain-containing protein
MKIALLAVGCLAAALFASQEKPCNATCPVMEGKAVKPRITSTYEGRTVAFCCTKCKKLWDKDPSEYAGNLPPVEKAPGGAEIGKRIPDFEVMDVDGRKIQSAFLKPLLVLQWIDPSCRTSQRLASGVIQATRDKLGSSVEKFHHVLVYSGVGASPPALKKFAQDQKLSQVILFDGEGKAAKALGAKTSSHVFVVDGEGILRYSGAIDDDPDGKKGDKAVNYVLEAVKAMGAKQPVHPETSTPYGTELKK